MSLDGTDRQKADKIRQVLLGLHVNATDQKTLEQDIHELLKAIDRAQDMRADTKDVRALLDRILTIVQVKCSNGT